MENDQRAKLDSYQRVQACNTINATELATITDYNGLQIQFDELVGEVMRTAGATAGNNSCNSGTPAKDQKEYGGNRN
jgi:hypothetical protein